MFLQFSKAVTNTHSQREKQGKRIMLLRCDSASTGTVSSDGPTVEQETVLRDGNLTSLPALSANLRSPNSPAPNRTSTKGTRENQHVLVVLGQKHNKNK